METVSLYSVHHDLEAIELLLNHGASANDRNEQPYDEYCEWKGACQWTGYSVLTYAAKEGWTAVVKLLLKKGADPSLPRTDGKSASELARAKGHIDTASVIEKYLEKKVVP
jgi:ankyrin repeat protein